jgi:hypothetical protein
MEQKAYSRRKFIYRWLGPVMAVMGGAVLWSGCHGGDKSSGANSGPASCDDLSGVSEDEIAKRKQLGYVQNSTVPGSHCGNCSLYVPAEREGGIGKCLLFAGPVCATGYCTQYVAKSNAG